MTKIEKQVALNISISIAIIGQALEKLGADKELLKSLTEELTELTDNIDKLV
jgi:hypothetical protein